MVAPERARPAVLDRELYRQAYAQYREWNKAELAECARHAGWLSPAEAWRRYVALVEFCWRLAPQQSQRQRERKLAYLNQYYARVQQLETWRQKRGKIA